MPSVKETESSFIESTKSVASWTQKRLGQYFTDPRLAKLLAHFGRIESCNNVIDPMAGSANMLTACHDLIGAPIDLVGIEIDQRVSTLASTHLAGKGRVINGNAFDSEVWSTLAPMWDLVITNPPYVRYQSLPTSAIAGSESFDMESVRQYLAAQVQGITDLRHNEKSLILRAISGYSGLADLSIPSWLLCASRVSIGGRMAIVFPTVWLSRKYAAPALAVLCRLFNLEYIIEDSSRSWFPNADVRTALLIAQRVKDKGPGVCKLPYKHVLISSAASTKNSVVGAVFPRSTSPEYDFVKWLDSTDDDDEIGSGSVQVACSKGTDILRTARCATQVLEDESRPIISSSIEDLVPELMVHMIGKSRNEFSALEQLGWGVGQGLRTGANDFFYVHRAKGGRWVSKLAPQHALKLPNGAVLPALIRQGELNANQRTVGNHTDTGLLYLNRYAREKDAKRSGDPHNWIPTPGDLDWLISAAEIQSYERNGRRVYLPELSAVKTNSRTYTKGNSRKPTRFWYQLPPLQQRHRPELFIPRVNHKVTRILLNEDRKLVIDANFSALWRRNDSALDQMALYAILGSAWTACYFELRATVLGAGALKVEAAHIKSLPIPKLNENEIGQLSNLGRRIVSVPGQKREEKRIRHRIDKIMVGALGVDDAASVVASLTQFIDRAINIRTHKG
ncbi:MAG: N-6 DNA methylase [Wenzhouxiangellaceae bacterium]